ncbi:ABC transporter substrate-binding protein [Alteribacillus sp. YIM 98480]|uniref:ABC transporter substrate-binding protein n=1 Tax=Alteribacillus sp. YIM 98480 TaxID=2606599 RepID=UPI00131C4A1D|nr:ABC transporter substrate-binding protein [Alteribacillus sp. YIM 98480]
MIVILSLLFLAACQVESKETTASDSEEIKVENQDEEIILKNAPERAISLNQHVTEIMLALGLEDRMVGTAYLDDAIHPDFKDAYEKVPVLAEQYPSQENILAEEPDFIYGGWESAFQNEAAGSRKELEQFGIASYLHESSNKKNPQLEDIFQDIENIGKIFQEEDAAETLINEMQSKVQEIKKNIPDTEKKEVFVYDSGDSAPLTAGQNFLNTLIEIGGAENIFGDLNKGWATVSWEEVAEADPDEIIIIDYGDTSVEDKKTFLNNHSVMKELKAVKEEDFTVIPLSEASEGIRAPEALEKIVDGIY